MMDCWSLAETVAGLASRAIGIWTLRFAFGCGFAFGNGAGSPEFPTTRFAVAVAMPDEPVVASLGDMAFARLDATEGLSSICPVRSDEISAVRGAFDV